MNKKAIEMLESLCDVISDMPCGCDCCPYEETMDDETGGCEVYETIKKIKRDSCRGGRMSEISREAIAYFQKRIEAEKQIINLPTCDKEVAKAKKKHIAYFEQAISDREKLEKIEQILIKCEDWHYDTCHALYRIEQIVKEVE